MNSIRRESRIIALNVLYSVEISGKNYKVAFETLPEDLIIYPKAIPYAQKVVENVIENLSKIDKIISKHIKNWKIERLSLVDKNILRIAVYEICSDSGVPPKSAINEAIEISKLFCEEKSSKFINGILDSVFRKGVKIG